LRVRGQGGLGWRLGLVAVIAGTAGYAVWLVASAGAQAPGWLLVVAAAAGAVATAVAAAGVLALGWAGRVAGGRLAGRDGWPLGAAVAAGLVAVLLVPAVASVQMVLRHEGAFDTPFEPAAQRAGIDALFVQTPAQVRLTIPQLEAGRNGARYLLVTQTAAVASVFIEDSGQEALPIGGFTGEAPSPTLAQLKADIRVGRFHLVLAGPSADPRLRWIAAHCRRLPFSAGALNNYYCTPPDAG
jgi:hypothetical protein